MKIDRVLFSLNNNKNYINFWNLNSKIWKLKFDVIPTLLYIGKKEEVSRLKLSEEFGEIYVLEDLQEDLCNGFSRKWYIPWSLFYGATLFPDEVCMTSGIDQIPLSNIFLEHIKEISEEKYIVGFSDAYRKKDFFPSSHHVAKGEKFKKKFEILNNWTEEVYRVFRKKHEMKNLYDSGYWGLDESYSSIKICEKSTDVYFNNDFFHTTWKQRRIDRAYGLNYSFDKLKNGWYTELHAPRPLEKYYNEIDKIIYLAHNI